MLAFNLKIDGCAKNPERSSITKTVRIFFVDIRYQQFGNLITYKTNILYIVEKIV